MEKLITNTIIVASRTILAALGFSMRATVLIGDTVDDDMILMSGRKAILKRCAFEVTG